MDPVKAEPKTKDLVIRCLCGKSVLTIKEAELLRPEAVSACIEPLVDIMVFCRSMFCGCQGQVLDL